MKQKTFFIIVGKDTQDSMKIIFSYSTEKSAIETFNRCNQDGMWCGKKCNFKIIKVKIKSI